MCDLIIAYIGLHHTLLHLLSLIDTWYLLQWSLPPSPQHNMYVHPATSSSTGILCFTDEVSHRHVCKSKLSTKVYDGWLAHSGFDPLQPIWAC